MDRYFYKEDFILNNYGNIDWNLSKGIFFRVRNDKIIYKFKYLYKDNKNQKIHILYNDKEYTIYTSGLMKGQIGKIIGSTYYGFRYSIGDIINDRKILKQIRKEKVNKNGRITYEKNYLVECIYDKYQYQITETMLRNNSKCPVCINRIIIKGINDIWTTNPELAKLLANPNEGYINCVTSKKSVDWVCPDCGKLIKNKIIYNVYKSGKVYCPICHDGFSYPEKLMNAILSFYNIDYEYHFTFGNQHIIFNDKPYYPQYDFYFEIDNKKYIIETDGGFHYKETNYPISLKDVQEIDKKKNELALKNNCILVRVNCYYEDYDYIVDNLKNSILNNIFDFNLLDKTAINLSALSNKVKEVCNLYMKKTRDIDELCNITKFKKQTVRNYLTKGSEIGLCDYLNVKEKYYKSRTPVVCLNTREKYISITEAYRDTNVSISAIYGCCAGKYLTGGKDKNGNYLIWKFEEEYSDMLKQNINIDDYIQNTINNKWKSLSKKIICLDTLEIFDSNRMAMKWSNIKNTSSITQCCRGETKTAGKHPKTGQALHWMYYNEYLKLKEDNKCLVC